MPRPSLNFDAVAAAAANLVANGMTPTLKNVRDALGSGSMSSIQPHLKKWAEAQPKASAAAFELPGRLRDALAAELARVAADARVEAEAKLQQAEADNADLAAAGTRVEEELEDVRGELVQMTTERDVLAGRCSEQASEIERLKDEAVRAREEADQVRQKLARAEIRLEALSDLQTQNETLRQATADANAKAAQAEKGQAVAEAKLLAEVEARNGMASRVAEAEARVKTASDQHRELLTRYDALYEKHLATVIAEGDARAELGSVRTALDGKNAGATASVAGEGAGKTEAKGTETKVSARAPGARRK